VLALKAKLRGVLELQAGEWAELVAAVTLKVGQLPDIVGA
jgi:hypothetical protein